MVTVLITMKAAVILFCVVWYFVGEWGLRQRKFHGKLISNR